jgi:arsenite/tail-anchored protein-transporting ATPase
MRPRTILYTGKGGVGKTSVAAASARMCARAGMRTVVLSTDPAHSLSDSLEVELGPEPTPAGERLWGQEVRAQREMESNWGAVQEWLAKLLADRGIERVRAEELTVPPGMDELFSLLQIKRHHQRGEFDVLIVDCAPTGETLRLLGFPDIARWWLERVFPWERRLVGAARPLARTFDVPLPGPEVFDDVQRLVRNLIEMDSILRNAKLCTIRLVMNPDRMVIKEAQRTFTYLNLYGYLTDAVIVNRIFPEDVEGGYFGAWLGHQRRNLEQVREGFAPLPILTSRFFEEEVVGGRMLDRLGADLFTGGYAPHDVLFTQLAQTLSMDGDTATLSLPIPFAEKGEIDLKKVGDELIVAVGGEKRTIILPSALADQSPSGANFEAGTLKVRFDDVRSSRPQPERV